MQIKVSKVKNGQKVIFRGVACMRCNRKDSATRYYMSNGRLKKVAPPKTVVLANLKNGSLYTVFPSSTVQLIPEMGIAG